MDVKGVELRNEPVPLLLRRRVVEIRDASVEEAELELLRRSNARRDDVDRVQHRSDECTLPDQHERRPCE